MEDVIRWVTLARVFRASLNACTWHFGTRGRSGSLIFPTWWALEREQTYSAAPSPRMPLLPNSKRNLGSRNNPSSGTLSTNGGDTTDRPVLRSWGRRRRCSKRRKRKKGGTRLGSRGEGGLGRGERQPRAGRAREGARGGVGAAARAPRPGQGEGRRRARRLPPDSTARAAAPRRQSAERRGAQGSAGRGVDGQRVARLPWTCSEPQLRTTSSAGGAARGAPWLAVHFFGHHER